MGLNPKGKARVRAKWPITINFGNILLKNTVSEQYSNLPLFMVLELGELEYHFFKSTVARWRGKGELNIGLVLEPMKLEYQVEFLNP